MSIFERPAIIKLTFTFPKFVSVCKKKKYIYIYILCSSCCEIWALCVSWITYDHLYTYIYIYIYIYIYSICILYIYDMYCIIYMILCIILYIYYILYISESLKTSNNKYDWTSIKYLNVLHHNITQKQLQYFILNILQKYY